MKKIRTSFALSPDSLSILKQLSELDSRSQAGMLEKLILDAGVKAKIKPVKQ